MTLIWNRTIGRLHPIQTKLRFAVADHVTLQLSSHLRLYRRHFRRRMVRSWELNRTMPVLPPKTMFLTRPSNLHFHPLLCYISCIPSSFLFFFLFFFSYFAASSEIRRVRIAWGNNCNKSSLASPMTFHFQIVFCYTFYLSPVIT